MDKNTLMNIEFDDIHNLVKEGKTFTEKVVALAENKEYIEFLVNDLINIDSSYFKRLIQLVTLDYTESIVERYNDNKMNNSKECDKNLVELYSELVELYSEKIITIVSHRVLKLYYKLFHTQNEAEYFISLVYNSIYALIHDYQFLIIEVLKNKDNMRNIKFDMNASINMIVEGFFEDIRYYDNNVTSDGEITVTDPVVIEAYNVLEEIMQALISNVEYDIMYLQGLEYVTEKEDDK